LRPETLLELSLCFFGSMDASYNPKQYPVSGAHRGISFMRELFSVIYIPSFGVDSWCRKGEFNS
jgi:hypothetical protein